MESQRRESLREAGLTSEDFAWFELVRLGQFPRSRAPS